MTLIRTIGISVLLVVVIACAPRVSKNAAQVAYHSTMSNLLDGCERLGRVTGEVEASWLTSEKGEKYQAEIALTEAALDKYSPDVDNVVFISTTKVTEGKNTIFAQGVAFNCK